MIDFPTLEQMRGQIGRHIGDLTSASKTRIDEWINLEYAKLVAGYMWPGLVHARETGVTTTAGEVFLYLPKDVDQLLVALPANQPTVATNQAIALFMARYNTSKDSVGDFQTFAHAGEFGRKADFSSTAEQITVDPAGTDTVDVRIRGMTATNDEVTETVTASNGVAADSTTSFTDVFNFTTNGAQTGVVTISGTTSATVYATIGANERTTRYRRLRLYLVPTGGTTVTIYYKKRVERLTNDDDSLEIPVAHVIIHKVISDQFSHQRKWQDAMRQHRLEAEDLLNKILVSEFEQGENIEQGVPLRDHSGRSGRRIVVVNNA